MKQKEDALFSAHAILAALRSSIRVLRWGMAALVLVYLASGITMVGPSQAGLVLRFGKLLPEVHPPGLLFALPAPIDEVVLIDAKTVQERTLADWAEPANASPQSLEFNATLHPVNDPYTLTGDANIIRAKFSARYQVSNAADYVFGATDRDELLDAVVYQNVCRVIAGMSVDDVLTTRRDFVSRETQRLSQAEIDRLGLGVQLLAIETREIDPPAQVAAAFQDVISAKVEAKTLIEPANSYHASMIPEAQAEAYRVKSAADTFAQEQVSQAQGQASAFLALLHEYKANPQLIRARLYNEMIQTTLAKVRITTVMPNANGEVRLLLAPQIGQTVESRPAEQAEPAEPGPETGVEPLPSEPLPSNKTPAAPSKNRLNDDEE